MTTRDVVPIRLKAHECRRIAVLAAVDPRTIQRFLRGLPIRSTCEARIREALAATPLLDLRLVPGSSEG